MLYVLDTNILTLYRRGIEPVTRHVLAMQEQEIATTIISVEEQLNGWQMRLRHPNTDSALASIYAEMTSTVTFLAVLRVLTFNEGAIARYKALQALKLNIGKMDLRIAAIALEFGGIVVTQNVRDFERIPGLIIEDWTRARNGQENDI